jgi:hypothetical protein
LLRPCSQEEQWQGRGRREEKGREEEGGEEDEQAGAASSSLLCAPVAYTVSIALSLRCVTICVSSFAAAAGVALISNRCSWNLSSSMKSYPNSWKEWKSPEPAMRQRTEERVSRTTWRI